MKYRYVWNRKSKIKTVLTVQPPNMIEANR